MELNWVHEENKEMVHISSCCKCLQGSTIFLAYTVLDTKHRSIHTVYCIPNMITATHFKSVWNFRYFFLTFSPINYWKWFENQKSIDYWNFKTSFAVPNDVWILTISFFFILRWFLLRLLHISFRRMSSVKWRLCFISANKQKTRLLEINIALFYHWNW